MRARGRITTALRSHVGRVRANNEDMVAADASIGLLVLADGMGGYNAGEVAAGIATRTIVSEVQRLWPALPGPGEDRQPDSLSPERLLTLAIGAAHQAVHDAARHHPHYRDMGTTVVTALLNGGTVTIAHVGDSRLYRYRNGRLKAYTRDHSLVEELVSIHGLSLDEARRHPDRNAVTRSLGAEPTVAVELRSESLAAGDILLLCSDGLSDMVPELQISLSLQQLGTDLPACAEDLVRLALMGGGRDNVSVILARVEQVGGARQPWYRQLMEWF